MMQVTNSRQEEKNREEEQKKNAQQKTQETKEKTEHELQKHPITIDRQDIEGRAREIRAMERAGASKQEVVDKTNQMIMGSVEYDISRAQPLEGLPLVKDESSKLRESIQRAIHDAADEILKKQEEIAAGKEEDRRKLIEQGRHLELVHE
jgi:hypothetical protein